MPDMPKVHYDTLESKDMFGFTHRFITGSDSEEKRTLLLMHGTGGSEHDLLEVGLTILPGASLISPLGKVNEGGAARFFRRFAEGVFDEDDIKRQADDLAEFLSLSSEFYGFDPNHVYALGYSNGANMAAAMMLLRPETLAGGAFWRSMIPLKPSTLPDLAGKQVLMMTGAADPVVPAENAKGLAHMLSEAGASVRHEVLPVGHNLIRPDVEITQTWFRGMSARI